VTEDAPADVVKPPAKRAIGEAGDVVLEDIVGARSASRTGTLAPIPTSGIGGLAGQSGAVGALGGLGFVSTGPSISAAWFAMSSTNVGIDGGPSTTLTRVSFQPSADVFVIRGLSVGGQIGYERSSIRLPGQTSSFDSSSVSLDPRVGYAIPITSGVAVWPRARMGVTLHQQTIQTPTPRQFRFGVDAPLAVRVSDHVLLDFGPELTYAVLDSNQGVVTRSLTFAGRGGLSLVF